ncbi:hypothetical protein BTVI_24411 [Pitangus sulphuratus]|nr:hypothetical protein BTVI_24411 [Pitangus sulphuratus]
MEGTYAGAICEMQPVGRSSIEEVHEGLSPMQGPHGGAGEEYEEEASSETAAEERSDKSGFGGHLSSSQGQATTVTQVLMDFLL